MADILLSKDADTLLCLIYKHYLQKRDAGINKSEAKFLGDINNINEIAKDLKWSISDIEDTCKELSRKAMLICRFADNTIYMAYLSDDGIAYLENRFKNGLSSLLKYLGKILPYIV